MSNLKGTIALEGMFFHAHHGYYADERRKGGQFRVDVYVTGNIQQGAVTDELEKTINYEEIAAAVQKVMKEEHHLLEHVAFRILEDMKKEIKGIDVAKVRISKIHPPLAIMAERAYVELEKTFRE